MFDCIGVVAASEVGLVEVQTKCVGHHLSY